MVNPDHLFTLRFRLRLFLLSLICLKLTAAWLSKWVHKKKHASVEEMLQILFSWPNMQTFLNDFQSLFKFRNEQGISSQTKMSSTWDTCTHRLIILQFKYCQISVQFLNFKLLSCTGLVITFNNYVHKNQCVVHSLKTLWQRKYEFCIKFI